MMDGILVKNNDLSIIFERMATKTVEVNHYPHHAHQSFFVIFATATIDIVGERIVLQKNAPDIESIVKLTSTKEVFYDRISLSKANPTIE